MRGWRHLRRKRKKPPDIAVAKVGESYVLGVDVGEGVGKGAEVGSCIGVGVSEFVAVGVCEGFVEVATVSE